MLWRLKYLRDRELRFVKQIHMIFDLHTKKELKQQTENANAIQWTLNIIIVGLY